MLATLLKDVHALLVAGGSIVSRSRDQEALILAFWSLGSISVAVTIAFFPQSKRQVGDRDVLEKKLMAASGIQANFDLGRQVWLNASRLLQKRTKRDSGQ